MVTIAIVIVVGSVLALVVFLTWLGGAIERSEDRLDAIAQERYYEQAERDGCEYPPQWRGR